VHTAALNDVTTGSNGTCPTLQWCTAIAGWDGPTGLGTPNGPAAFTAANTITVTNPGSQPGTVYPPVSLQIQASDSGSGATLSYTGSGLPPGLSINSSTGLISGTPSTVGTYTVTVTASDATSATGRTTFTWTVRTPGALVALSPARVLDTRIGMGAVRAPVAAGGSVAVQITGAGGVPSSGVSAVVVNVAVTEPAAAGFVTVWAGGAPRPTASNLNFVAGQTVPNLVVAPVGADGKIQLYNSAGGSTELVADVAGYYLQ